MDDASECPSEKLATMKLLSLKREWILWVMILLPLIPYFLLAGRLPAEIPAHFDLGGHADAFMSPAKLLWNIVPVNVLLYGVLLVLPYLDPRKKNYFLFTKAYFYIRLVIHLFLSVILCFMILSATGWNMSMIRLTGLAVMLLLAILGNYLVTVKPNWFVGIRTPWTLDNELVWRKTHQVGGRLMFILGVLGFILVTILPVKTGGKALLPIVLVSVLVPLVYSYVLYRKIKREES